MADQDTPRPPPGSFIVVVAALLILFFVVSRLGKTEDPTGIYSVVADYLPAGRPAAASRVPAPDMLATDPGAAELQRRRGEILRRRGLTAQVIGRVGHDPETGAAAAAGNPPMIAARAPHQAGSYPSGEPRGVALPPPSAPRPRVRNSAAAGDLPPAIPAAASYANAAPPIGANLPEAAPAVHDARGQTAASRAGVPAWDGAAPLRHTVAAGESLAGIAELYYRDRRAIGRLMRANPALADNPRVRAGMSLVVPALPELAQR